jgi:nucleotide-binding universal stress UspA family protein
VEEIVCQRIMVVIDGSTEGHAAARYATQLARRLHASLIVVGIVDASVCSDPHDLLGSSYLLDRVEQYRSEEVDEVDSEARRVEVADVTRCVVVGDPFVDLVSAIHDHEADLVVLGSRRCGTIQRLLMANPAEYLVRHAPVPVLVVRSDQDRHRGPRVPAKRFITEDWTRAKSGGERRRRLVAQLLHPAVGKV